MYLRDFTVASKEGSKVHLLALIAPFVLLADLLLFFGGKLVLKVEGDAEF